MTLNVTSAEYAPDHDQNGRMTPAEFLAALPQTPDALVYLHSWFRKMVMESAKFSMTRAARPLTIASNHEVTPAIRVAFRAVSFSTHHCPGRLTRICAPNIHLWRHRLQVVWVYTTADPTQMIQLQIRWNRPAHKLIRDAVGHTVTPLYKHSTIAALSRVSHPCPTSTLRNRYRRCKHGLNRRCLRYSSTQRSSLFNAYDTPEVYHISFRYMTVWALITKKIFYRASIDSIGACDNRARIGNIWESHAIGSFDQVVRGRLAATRLAAPLTS